MTRPPSRIRLDLCEDSPPSSVSPPESQRSSPTAGLRQEVASRNSKRASVTTYNAKRISKLSVVDEQAQHFVINGGGSINGRTNGGEWGSFADLFGADVFNTVLNNPATARRLLQFCQSKACGEDIEFLEMVTLYHAQLANLSTLLASIQNDFLSSSTSPVSQINLPHNMTRRLATEVKNTIKSTIPSLETLFVGAQEHIKTLLAGDLYPRFVKHQVTLAAAHALSGDKSMYPGLGRSFCITDSSASGDPIILASDSFVDVTGYSRKDVVLRNCRIMQGALTDRASTKRLQESVERKEETVELLLNYRKNGEPFWNLLYVAPLLDEKGNVKFFLGGQIDCSKAIHSGKDILNVLSSGEEEEGMGKPGGQHSQSWKKGSGEYFRTLKKMSGPKRELSVKRWSGIEGQLPQKLGRMSLLVQLEAFYTAYSKYIVLKFLPTVYALTVSHYSAGVTELLGLNHLDGGPATIYNMDIFRVLAEFNVSSSSMRSYRSTVLESIKKGAAVSVELGLPTGGEVKKRFNVVRAEEKYISHWTPLKDEEGRTRSVILIIAPK